MILTDSYLQKVILQAAAAADGNGIVIDVYGKASLLAYVEGSFTAKVKFEASADGTTFLPLLGQNLSTGEQVSETTAPGLFVFSVIGVRHVRAKVSNYSNGTVTVTAHTSPMVTAFVPQGGGGGGGSGPSFSSTVTIDNVEYRLLEGNVLVGLNTDKPDAVDAANAVGIGVIYWSVDTDPALDALEVSDGTQWLVMA